MRKYHGTVIHRCQDSLGIIEVVDAGYTRSLHFGNAVRQSATDLSRPQHLVLNYTRAMMGSLLFRPSPRNVLLVGLGGGSLAKFLLHHFPHCSIDAVEYRELVVKLAHGYFLLPDDQRLLIHVADGAGFVQRMAAVSSGRYDLILVDAYNSAGMDDGMGEEAFIHNCYALLAAEGLLAINLWGRDQPIFNRVRRILQECFAAKPLLLPSEGTTNVIAMSPLRNDRKNLLKTAESRAKLLEQQTGLELVRLSRTLRKHNGSPLNRIFH
jgi:spermidine synthase